MHRNNNIDELRGLAVLLAVYNHLGGLFPGFQFPFRFVSGTWAGVNLFFVISGFVVSLAFVERFDRSPSRASAILDFFKKRIRRLFPACFFWLLFIFLCCLFFNDSHAFPAWSIYKSEVIPVLFYFYNYYLAKGATNTIGWHWSLAVEEQFYFLFPWTLVIFKSWKNRLIAYSLAAAMIIFFIRPTLASLYAEVPYFRFSTHTTLDAILLGCILYQIKFRLGHDYEMFYYWLHKNKLIAPAKMIGVLAITLTAGILMNVQTVGYTLINFSSCLLVYLSSCEDNHISPKTQAIYSLKKILLWIGQRSYSIYLCHVPTFWFIREVIYRFSGRTTETFSTEQKILVVLSAIAAVSFFSHASYIYIEKKFIKKHTSHKLTNNSLLSPEH